MFNIRYFKCCNGLFCFTSNIYANELSNDVQEDSIEQIADENVVMDESLDLSDDDDLDSENSILEEENVEKEILKGDISFLKYLVVTEPYLMTSNTEKFILSFQSGMYSVSLVYTDNSGFEFVVSGVEQEAGKYVFDKLFQMKILEFIG